MIIMETIVVIIVILTTVALADSELRNTSTPRCADDSYDPVGYWQPQTQQSQSVLRGNDDPLRPLVPRTGCCPFLSAVSFFTCCGKTVVPGTSTSDGSDGGPGADDEVYVRRDGQPLLSVWNVLFHRLFRDNTKPNNESGRPTSSGEECSRGPAIRTDTSFNHKGAEPTPSVYCGMLSLVGDSMTWQATAALLCEAWAQGFSVRLVDYKAIFRNRTTPTTVADVPNSSHNHSEPQSETFESARVRTFEVCQPADHIQPARCVLVRFVRTYYVLDPDLPLLGKFVLTKDVFEEFIQGSFAVVVNIAVHYLDTQQSELRRAYQILAQWIRSVHAKYPDMQWLLRDSFPQHFYSPQGDGSFEHAISEERGCGCMALSHAAVRNWRDALMDEFLLTTFGASSAAKGQKRKNRLGETTSTTFSDDEDSETELGGSRSGGTRGNNKPLKAVSVDVFAPMASRWRFHLRAADCTHFCWSRNLFHPWLDALARALDQPEANGTDESQREASSQAHASERLQAHVGSHPLALTTSTNLSAMIIEGCRLAPEQTIASEDDDDIECEMEKKETGRPLPRMDSLPAESRLFGISLRNSEEQARQLPDILLIGLSLTTRVQWMERLPRSARFLRRLNARNYLQPHNTTSTSSSSKFRVFVFHNAAALGQGSASNLMPLLSGTPYQYSPNRLAPHNRSPCPRPTSPWLWQVAKQSRYVTARIGAPHTPLSGSGNDAGSECTNGFSANWDHEYLREQTYHDLPDSMERDFEFVENVFRAYPVDPKFVYLHFNLCRDRSNSNSSGHLALDRPLRRALGRTIHRHPKTVIVLYTTSGQPTDPNWRRIFLSLVSPAQQLNRGSLPVHLNLNQRRLVSFFDVYYTVRELMLGFPTAETSPSSSPTATAGIQAGLSLFWPIPTNRTCAEAGFLTHRCSCGSHL